MKTLLVTLLFPVLLKSCEGVPDQVGTPPLPPAHTPGSTRDNTNSTDTNGTNGTTDVPFDAGLSFLLVAGAGYGVKRYRKAKDTGE